MDYELNTGSGKVHEQITGGFDGEHEEAVTTPWSNACERSASRCLMRTSASHGEPTWFAGKGKVFAMLDDHHHGSPHLSVWLPQRHGVQSD